MAAVGCRLGRCRVCPRGRLGGEPRSRPGETAAPAGEHQGAGTLEHRGQVRHAAVRLHRRAKPERRLRRRDRTLVREVRLRQGEPGHHVVRHDTVTRAGAHDRPRRPGDRDLHVQHRPRDAHRLLARVLQGNRSAAREERRLGAGPERPRGQDDRDDERLGLRPLGQELLQGHESSSSRTGSRTPCSRSATGVQTRSCSTTRSCSGSPSPIRRRS